MTLGNWILPDVSRNESKNAGARGGQTLAVYPSGHADNK
jgi:hypothetical protein